MNDQIRRDLEPIIRDTLSKRPEFRLKSVEPIPEGHSGFTYFVDVEDAEGPARYVLRLPPPGARIAGPADVVRQGKIMSALHRAGLPVPAIPVMSSDPVIDVGAAIGPALGALEERLKAHPGGAVEASATAKAKGSD